MEEMPYMNINAVYKYLYFIKKSVGKVNSHRIRDKGVFAKANSNSIANLIPIETSIS
jgi:6-phosphogluconolactonase (cycloisomerase 2 family)